MTELNTLGQELDALLQKNSHLVKDYTALHNAQRCLAKDDVHNAFMSIRIDMDKFRYAFPELTPLVERFESIQFE